MSIDALACTLYETNMQNFKGMNPDENIIMLDFRNNEIETFYGLPTLPNAQCMRFDNNKISSFRGMSFQPNLQVLTLLNNPIVRNPQYRILALLACGPSLREIDGAVVSPRERQLYENCGGADGWLAQMVSLGWTSLEIDPQRGEEWSMEKVKGEYMRYVAQEVDDGRSFGALAEKYAEIVPLAADNNGNNNNQQQQQQRTTQNSNNPQQEQNINSNNNNKDQLTLRDVNAILFSPQQPHFGRNGLDAREASKYGAQQLINTHRSNNIAEQQQQQQRRTGGIMSPDDKNNNNNFAVVAAVDKKKEEEELQLMKANPLELARRYAKAYSAAASSSTSAATTSANHHHHHLSQGPSPASPMNASPNNNNNAGGKMVYSGANSANGQTNIQQVSGDELTLSRADIINLGCIELAHFDVSAQWQPPKNGTIQIVRSTLRVEFDFFPVAVNNTQPRLVVLDDAGQVVAVFPLSVSSVDKPQSLWIHDGNPPAIALCSEHDGGVIDVVIMPSAGTAGDPTSKSQTLHKILIHAMAEHNNNSKNMQTKNNQFGAAASSSVTNSNQQQQQHQNPVNNDESMSVTPPRAVSTATVNNNNNPNTNNSPSPIVARNGKNNNNTDKPVDAVQNGNSSSASPMAERQFNEL